MSLNQGTNTAPGATPAPAAYAPVTPPALAGNQPNPLAGLTASGAMPFAGMQNPFALGGRSPGDYVPAPARPPMSVPPNGGFPSPQAPPPINTGVAPPNRMQVGPQGGNTGVVPPRMMAGALRGRQTP